ncbi:hypothetical protein CXG81DRAFT_17325 [Caulochytrium protostelioides]|uniref:RING-type domain-containing protein n=1 Tax=Caulochytrium protostelioides TaxID=1555241 RepID=A0A4P9XC93_9FUNG|nr:hypothetical protein CXG81DRAFT_17325 [Caulochytrium protostelioides]|eukprot:RKP03064.1 hypothetical protein CXG81DRAFT_17325 [Caulochytrium protostelioides]
MTLKPCLKRRRTHDVAVADGSPTSVADAMTINAATVALSQPAKALSIPVTSLSIPTLSSSVASPQSTILNEESSSLRRPRAAAPTVSPLPPPPAVDLGLMTATALAGDSQTPTPVAELRAILSCQICYELYCHPATLTACGHTFCGPCILRWCHYAAACPACRTPIATPPAHPLALAQAVARVATVAERAALGQTSRRRGYGLASCGALWATVLRRAAANRADAAAAAASPSRGAADGSAASLLAAGWYAAGMAPAPRGRIHVEPSSTAADRVRWGPVAYRTIGSRHSDGESSEASDGGSARGDGNDDDDDDDTPDGDDFFAVELHDLCQATRSSSYKRSHAAQATLSASETDDDDDELMGPCGDIDGDGDAAMATHHAQREAALQAMHLARHNLARSWTRHAVRDQTGVWFHHDGHEEDEEDEDEDDAEEREALWLHTLSSGGGSDDAHTRYPAVRATAASSLPATPRPPGRRRRGAAAAIAVDDASDSEADDVVLSLGMSAHAPARRGLAPGRGATREGLDGAVSVMASLRPPPAVVHTLRKPFGKHPSSTKPSVKPASSSSSSSSSSVKQPSASVVVATTILPSPVGVPIRVPCGIAAARDA